MKFRVLIALTLAALAAGCGSKRTSEPAAAQTLATQNLSTRNGIAKEWFGAETVASPQAPAAYGSYSRGCLAGAQQLPETGPTWQAMRLSRNRNWGHPELIDFVQDLSRKAARLPGWSGIYVGDLSQPRGGPMLTGHASHQVGLDADFWLRPADRLNLGVDEREKISAISYRRSNGAFVNDGWTRQHHELLKAAASDPRVARIFIFPGAKVQMCKDEKGDRAWLRKIRPWWGHHYHFHVRLSCPKGSSGCVDQSPPPPGDGCAEAQQWVNNILNPPPPDPNAPPPKPKRELTMADLPAACSAVLSPL